MRKPPKIIYTIDVQGVRALRIIRSDSLTGIKTFTYLDLIDTSLHYHSSG